MDRLPISSAVPADIAELMSDMDPEEFTAEDLKEAREEMGERLLAGRAVAGCTFIDLIDCEFNSRTNELLGDLDTLLRKEGGADTVEGFARRMRDAIIERHLEDSQDVVIERAAEIASERLES